MSRAESPQAVINTATWTRRNLVGAYSSRGLRGAESEIIRRHRDALAGTVLELGCGAGRLTGHLIAVGGDVHGIDVSPRMVDYCRRHYRDGTFNVWDLRDLAAFADRSFGAVVATCNVLDVLDDDERRAALEEINRVLGPGGLLVMSSHNRDAGRRIDRPTRLRTDSMRGLIKSAALLPRRALNHRRLAPLERETEGYAIRNDEAHGFALLHYYISANVQAKQLAEHGFALIECLDPEGQRLRAGEPAACDYDELYYVARCMGSARAPRAQGDGDRLRQPRFTRRPESAAASAERPRSGRAGAFTPGGADS
jgi:SAM-dependent methyltransferase